jgi:hypothetical protein
VNASGWVRVFLFWESLMDGTADNRAEKFSRALAWPAKGNKLVFLIRYPWTVRNALCTIQQGLDVQN